MNEGKEERMRRIGDLQILFQWEFSSPVNGNVTPLILD